MKQVDYENCSRYIVGGLFSIANVIPFEGCGTNMLYYEYICMTDNISNGNSTDLYKII